MREIKFRAWVGSEMLQDVGIIPFMHEGSAYQDPYGSFFLKGDSDKLMQYTGLKDKNGVEIYEGDILDWGGLKPIQIVWRDAGLRSDFKGSDIIHLTQEGMSAFGEVIGNIYENPELLAEAGKS